MNPEIRLLILKQKRQVEEVIRKCPLYLPSEFDYCNDECPVYSYCWQLQDEEEKNLNGVKLLMSTCVLSEAKSSWSRVGETVRTAVGTMAGMLAPLLK